MVAQRSQSLPEGGFCARFRREIRGTAISLRRRYGAGDGGDVPVVRWIRRRCERLEVSFITPKAPFSKFAVPHSEVLAWPEAGTTRLHVMMLAL